MYLQSFNSFTIIFQNVSHGYAIPVLNEPFEVAMDDEALPEELLASAGFLLARVGSGLKTRLLDELEQAGCPGFQYGVLVLLHEGPAQTQGRIADVLGIAPSQLVGELDELEAGGLIERRRHPGDRRRHTVAITAKGNNELVKLRKVVRRVEDDYLAAIGPEARQQLHDLLLRVAGEHDTRYRRKS